MHIIISWHSSRAPLCDSLSINSLQTDMHNVACSGSFDHGTSPHPTNPARTNASMQVRELEKQVAALKTEQQMHLLQRTDLDRERQDLLARLAGAEDSAKEADRKLEEQGTRVQELDAKVSSIGLLELRRPGVACFAALLLQAHRRKRTREDLRALSDN